MNQEKFNRMAETWWSWHLTEQQFKSEQAHVNEVWKNRYPSMNPLIDQTVVMPTGYVYKTLEQRTYVRVYNIDRNQDIWERKYPDV